MLVLKKTCISILIALAACGLTGMSGIGVSARPNKIPTPDKNFAVTLIDRADVTVGLTDFSIEGLTYLIGFHGKGKLAVPFNKIKKTDFSLRPEGLTALIGLKDGNSLTLVLEKGQKGYGRTQLGNYQIKLEDIKTLIIDRQILIPTTGG